MTTSSTNFTGLYGGGTATAIPNSAYGNANVVSLLAAGTDGANTVGNIVAVGNISGNYFLGNGALLTGIAASYGNSNVTALLSAGISSNVITTANISGGYILGNGSQLTGLPATYSNANVATYLASGTLASNVITTANISGQYILGNGSQLAGLPATYSNANVVTLLANFGSNSISTTGNVTAAYFAGNGSLLSNINAANITGAYGNANVVSLLAGFGSNAISTTGNITAGYVIGNGSLLTSLTGANVSGTVANATYALNANAATFAGTVTTAAQPNITSVGTLTSVTVTGNIVGGNVNTAGQVSAAGNITGGNITTTGTLSTSGNLAANNLSATNSITGNIISATGNLISPTITTTGGSGNITGVDYIFANFFSGNGSLLTGVTATLPSTISVTGNITGGNLNTAGTVSTSGAVIAGGNITGGNIGTAGILSATGNLTGGNLFATNSIINSTNTFSLATTPATGRVIVGPGYAGDYTNTYDPLQTIRGSQLAVYGKYAVGNSDTNQAMRGLTSLVYIDAAGGTLNSSTRRLTGGAFQLNLGNGTYTVPTLGSMATFAGSLTAMTVGNTIGTGAGNATVSHAVGHFGGVNVQGGGTVGNLISFLSNPAGGNSTATITTQMAYGINQTATTGQASPTNVFGLYNPNATGTYGFVNSNINRAATNYYFLRNDDDVAQNKLGSLRAYQEFNAVSGTTSGALTIDKTAGQVQQVNLTGNISGITFSNFVSSASDGTNTDEQCDTVTIIFNQGATANYGVTFPTGATYKYAGNITALQSVAVNSVSLVSVSAIRISSTTTYLITISPGFV